MLTGEPLLSHSAREGFPGVYIYIFKPCSRKETESSKSVNRPSSTETLSIPTQQQTEEGQMEDMV